MILWDYIRDAWGWTPELLSNLQASKLRLAALDIVSSLEGLGEEGGNNRGKHVEEWLGSVGRPGGEAWCAAVLSYGYITAAAETGIKMPFKPSSSAKRLTKNMIAAGREVSIDNVSPGDVICLHRGSKSWTGHVMMVVRKVDDSVVVIEGNKGKYPAKVAVNRYKIADLEKKLYKCASLVRGFSELGNDS